MPVATTQSPVADRLPATASNLPLIGMMGLIALGAAFSLRMIEKRAR
jgi:MYXO-CTERM domain-containing protein